MFENLRHFVSKYAKLAILYLLVLAHALVYSIPGWVVYLLWGKKLEWKEGVFVFLLKPKSWPLRTWFKKWSGMCLGLLIFLRHFRRKLFDHEKVHTEQFQGQALAGLIIGSALALRGFSVVESVVVGLSLPVLLYLCASAVAWLRGEDSYRGNVNEEAARAIRR
jgi:hypothetical protein